MLAVISLLQNILMHASTALEHPVGNARKQLLNRKCYLCLLK